MTALNRTDFTVLGMYLDRKRIRLRLTERDVARICGVPLDDVRRVIDGKRIGPVTLQAFCDWLERSPSFFDTQSLTAKRETYP
ncbi:hypothetical protein [Brucella intermedia]|uniref:hypothetical protein n=1 Tax=Brucella intermedia TaxID=94625 RepID=UPI000469FE44|nr:hypothetical protein [Brucella intermedia]